MADDAFLPQEIVRRKRDGEALEPAEIAAFVGGLADGSVTDAQIAAFAMAVHFRGMSRAECVALTEAMTRSGERLAWDGLALDWIIIIVAVLTNLTAIQRIIWVYQHARGVPIE